MGGYTVCVCGGGGRYTVCVGCACVYGGYTLCGGGSTVQASMVCVCGYVCKHVECVCQFNCVKHLIVN